MQTSNKTIQNISIIKVKINNNNIEQEIYRTKQTIYIIVVNKIVVYTNSYKQKKSYNIVKY